jgi:hypothetical protein
MRDELVLSLNQDSVVKTGSSNIKPCAKEKSGSTEPLTKRQGREGRISGKAMQDEVEAYA